MTPVNGWSEYERLVLYRLDEHSLQLKGLEKKVDNLQNSLLVLKVKAGIYGTLAGFFAGVLIKVLFK